MLDMRRVSTICPTLVGAKVTVTTALSPGERVKDSGAAEKALLVEVILLAEQLPQEEMREPRLHHYALVPVPL